MHFRKGLLFILLSIVISTGVKSQTEVDSLEGQINETSHDSVKVKILQRLATIFANSDANKSMAYAFRALNFADTLVPNKVSCDLFHTLAVGHLKTGQFDECIALSARGLRMAKKIDYDIITSQCYLRIGQAYVSQGQIDNSIAFLDTALMYQDDIKNDVTLKQVYQILSYIYFQKGDYSSSLTNALNSLEIAERNNDEKAMARNNSNIGGLFIKLTDYKRALSHLDRSRKWAEAENNLSMLADVYSNMGLAYEINEVVDTALMYFEKALKIGQAINQPPTTMAGTYSNIATIHIDKNELLLAETALLKGLDLTKNAVKHPFRASILTNMCEVYTLQNKLDQAHKLCEEALILNQEINNKIDLPQILKRLSDVYEKKRDYKSAYQTTKELYVTEKSLLNESKLVEIEGILLNSKFAKEQLADSLQYIQELNTQQLEIDKKRNQQRWFLLGILLLAALLGALYYAYSIKSKANGRIAKEKEEAERQKELAEKQRERAEQSELKLQELDSLKTRLYTNITHEFRTPLTVMLGIARQYIDRPEQISENSLSMVVRNGESLLSLVNQMLDLNKLESGRLALNQIQDDLIFYLKYLVESIHSLAITKNLSIDFNSNVSELVMDFDPERIKQIVFNLLSNAVKFTPEGGDIDVQLQKNNSSEGELLEIEVSNTGPGIPPDQLTHVFDRFYQIDDSATRAVTGTGIGLALVKELVQLIGGSVSATSVEGHKTTFKVVLPVSHNAERQMSPATLSAAQFTTLHQATEHSQSEANAAVAQRVSNDQALPSLLIIEDNEDVVSYLVSCLQEGYHILVGTDGQEGIDIAIEQTPDLIITDVMMPKKDGFEVCSVLRQDLRTSHIPIIMLTAKADMASKLEGLQHGADAYITKPFHHDELVLRAQKLLENRKKLQEYYATQMNLETSKEVINDDQEVPEIENIFLLKIKSIVSTHLADPNFNIEDFRIEMGMSASQLQRKFIALTGLSPVKYVRKIRLDQSKVLLGLGELNISEIAYNVGFNDPSYFGRIFKKEFGVTPQEYVGGAG